jgi:hypothetical protein
MMIRRSPLLVVLLALSSATASSCAESSRIDVIVKEGGPPTDAPLDSTQSDGSADAGTDGDTDALADTTVSEAAADGGLDASADATADVQPDAEPTLGLGLHYKLDSTSGNELDSSGNGHSGVISGTVQRGVAGKDGLAFDFINDGRIVATSSPSLDMLTGGTIQFWIKLSSVTPGAIVSRGTGANDNSVRIKTAQGNLQVSFTRIGTSTSVTSNTNVLPSNAWAHVAVVNDGSLISVYVDGSLVTTGPGGQLGPISANLYVGQNAANEAAMNGALDDLRWWTVARSASEVCQDAGGTPSSTDGAPSCTLP